MYVARGEALVDTIPLHEIISVEEMKDEPENARGSQITGVAAVTSEKSMASSETTSEKEPHKKTAKSSRQSIIQVKTALDGFNFGRIYYLKPSIGSSGADIVRDLLGAVQIARSIVERKSKFQKSQDMVRGVQESLGFQILVAILIMLVRAPRFLLRARPPSAPRDRGPRRNSAAKRKSIQYNAIVGLYSITAQ
jgi:hypothetical protein